MGNPILLVKDAGYGETPVPEDAIVQPGEIIEAFRDAPGYPKILLKCLAVAPPGQPIEYALADQAKPRRARPLLLSDRDPSTETIYVLREVIPAKRKGWKHERWTRPELFKHSELMQARVKADQAREAGLLPGSEDGGTEHQPEDEAGGG